MDKKLKAFTLMEILVVMGIIGILGAIGLVKFMPKVTEAKTIEAKLQLNHLYTLQDTHFLIHSKYSDSFDDLGYEQLKLVKDGGTANYLIEITGVTNTGFKAIATSITDFDKDGNFNQWEIDEEKSLKEVQKD